MKNDFGSIIEGDGDWNIASCPEVPGGNVQGRKTDEARQSLAAAIIRFLGPSR
jgi:hypothetical protein